MLGRDDMREFLRIAGINIYDILKENFDNPLLKGALSLDAVLGTFSGPRSNNSVFTALHRMSGNNCRRGRRSLHSRRWHGRRYRSTGRGRPKSRRRNPHGSPVRSILMEA